MVRFENMDSSLISKSLVDSEIREKSSKVFEEELLKMVKQTLMSRAKIRGNPKDVEAVQRSNRIFLDLDFDRDGKAINPHLALKIEKEADAPKGDWNRQVEDIYQQKITGTVPVEAADFGQAGLPEGNNPRINTEAEEMTYSTAPWVDIKNGILAAAEITDDQFRRAFIETQFLHWELVATKQINEVELIQKNLSAQRKAAQNQNPFPGNLITLLDLEIANSSDNLKRYKTALDSLMRTKKEMLKTLK
jgi:hypothetical protein